MLTDRSRTSESDAFFKSIEPDWYDTTSGDADAPTGWFGIVRIDSPATSDSWPGTPNFRDGWEAAGYDQIPASVEDGLYLVTIDSNGLVWAETSDIEAEVHAHYAEKESAYDTWSQDPEAECDSPDCGTHCGPIDPPSMGYQP